MPLSISARTYASLVRVSLKRVRENTLGAKMATHYQVTSGKTALGKPALEKPALGKPALGKPASGVYEYVQD